MQEIADVLNLHVGIMGYVAKFWMGFFPLLIIELLQGSIEQEVMGHCHAFSLYVNHSVFSA